MSRAHLACCALVLSVVVVGCSGPAPATDVPVTYVEPGWMAEVRSQNEEYAQAGVACMLAEGFDAVPMGGLFVLITQDDPVNGPPPEVAAARTAAFDKCASEVPPQAYTALPPEVEYDRILDLRACLIDQGYAMPEPPSREVWVESFASNGNPWSPYFDEFNPDPAATAPHQVTSAEMDRLQSVCPPSQVGTVISSE